MIGGFCLASAKASDPPARRRPNTSPSLVQSLHRTTTTGLTLDAIHHHPPPPPSQYSLASQRILLANLRVFLTPILAASTRLGAAAARRSPPRRATSQPAPKPASQRGFWPPSALEVPLSNHVTIPNVLHPRIQCPTCTSKETQHKAASARNQRR